MWDYVAERFVEYKHAVYCAAHYMRYMQTDRITTHILDTVYAVCDS